MDYPNEVRPQTLSHQEDGSEPTSANSSSTLQGADGLEGLDELEAPEPVNSHEDGPSLEGIRSNSHHGVSPLDELAAPLPIDTNEGPDLEDARHASQTEPNVPPEKTSAAAVYWTWSNTYTLSYLVFFSILGTLARLGLQAITIYPGAPVALGEIWANVGGTFVMGFLSEDRSLFRRDLVAATQRTEKHPTFEQAAALKKEHLTIKKGIPLYVGLSVGFCGCFTTFSSFMRDAFLALSNDLNTAVTSSKVTTSAARPRNDGYSVESVLAVLILEIAASLAALDLGAHVAILVEPVFERIPRLENANLRAILDPVAAVLAWPMWLGTVFMAIWPPHDRWRGQAVFALVFAPLGCLLRFYLSLWLNGRLPRFPLGTFAANVFGTMVLGMSFDLQRAAVGGGVAGCQVLQGVEDGFCGCLTTVSTWILELKSLRRRHAYVYGAVSLAVGLGSLVIIMGSLRWTVGFLEPECKV
ncbi:Fluoride export protein 1 [Lasiodiplodia hormozganensis]|uniref:Fluoride export protein 1 n=1 Tax=Lasiodiplodia hormozganensis TaxID=869390 RepID=A0AA39YII9_9PEZI|nr:Fluoride export protein 1 [Lasiodiplodia hormozganensis]